MTAKVRLKPCAHCRGGYGVKMIMDIKGEGRNKKIIDPCVCVRDHDHHDHGVSGDNDRDHQRLS